MERCIEITEKLISGQDYHYALFSDIHTRLTVQLKLLKSHLDICKKQKVKMLEFNLDLM